MTEIICFDVLHRYFYQVFLHSLVKLPCTDSNDISQKACIFLKFLYTQVFNRISKSKQIGLFEIFEILVEVTCINAVKSSISQLKLKIMQT